MDPDTPGIQTDIVVPGGAEASFDIDLVLTAVSEGYNFWQWEIAFPDAALDAISDTDMPEGAPTGWANPVDIDAVGSTAGALEIYGNGGGAYDMDGYTSNDTPYVLVRITLQCKGNGAGTLTVYDLTDDPNYGTSMSGQSGQLPTTTVDGTFYCGTPNPAVGGIAELPSLAGPSSEEAGAPGEGSAWPAGGYAALASGVAAAVAIAGGLWHAKRRWRKA
jgi:hypothetical protein